MEQSLKNRISLIAIAILLSVALLFSKILFSNEQYSSHVIFFLVICLTTFLFAYHLQRQADQNKQNYCDIESLTNNMSGGIVTYALDNKLSIIYANDGYYNLIGYSRDEVKNKFNNSGFSFMGTDELLDQMLSRPSSAKNAKDINLEFQLKRKDGTMIWVRSNCHRTVNLGKTDTISYLMMDITESKKAEKELMLEKERYHIATELTNDIIFEYDIVNDQMDHSAKYQDLFGYASLIPNFSQTIEGTKRVSPTTLENLKTFCQDLQSGVPTMSTEVELLDAQSNYTWCHVKGKTIYDSKGNPTKVIGKIVNIDAQKKALENLQNKACRDPLTGLYNKIVTKTLIEDIINVKKPRHSHAFMIIDIDNFKTVNDTLGHLIGDEVLVNVTSQLKSLFGKKDIVGRIGGDEFVVFMSDINSTNDILIKAAALSRVLRCDYHTDTKECSISGSIGISVYPNDGKTYTELLKSADTALYAIKNRGKDNFALAKSSDKYCF